MRRFLLVALFLAVFGNALCFAQTKEEYYRNGYVYFSQGDYARALESYQKALELDPQFIDARYWLGKTLEQMKRLPEAVREWRAVLTVAPRHHDAFQKWRAYAPSFVRDGEAVEKYRAMFLGEGGSPNIAREEGWSSLAPLAFVLLQQKDFSSLYLAAKCFQWAGERLSPLFVPYEERALRGALENITQDDWERNPRLVYRFLQEVTPRSGKSSEWRGLLEEALERVFAYTVGGLQGLEAYGVEFALAGGEVQKRVLQGKETGDPTAFFLGE